MTHGEALVAYAAGRISFSALRNALADSTDFVFHSNGTVEITLRRPLPKTVVRPDDVRLALTRYQAGELTVEELSIWALVLDSLDAFEVRAINDSAEKELWQVIAHLSVAAISNAFDDSRALDLLARLSRVP